MSKRQKPLSRLQQLREQIVKMGGDDLPVKFETLQLHAGMGTVLSLPPAGTVQHTDHMRAVDRC